MCCAVIPRPGSWQHLQISSAVLYGDSAGLITCFDDLLNSVICGNFPAWYLIFQILWFLSMNWNFYAIYPNLCWHRLTSGIEIVEENIQYFIKIIPTYLWFTLMIVTIYEKEINASYVTRAEFWSWIRRENCSWRSSCMGDSWERLALRTWGNSFY